MHRKLSPEMSREKTEAICDTPERRASTPGWEDPCEAAHITRCISTSVISAPPPSPNAVEVRRVSHCRFHARYPRRPYESGDGDIQGRERYSSRA